MLCTHIYLDCASLQTSLNVFVSCCYLDKEYCDVEINGMAEAPPKMRPDFRKIKRKSRKYVLRRFIVALRAINERLLSDKNYVWNTRNDT